MSTPRAPGVRSTPARRRRRGWLLVPGLALAIPGIAWPADTSCASVVSLSVGDCSSDSSGDEKEESRRPEKASTDPVTEFVRLINRERERRGLRALSRRAAPASVASRHSRRMAAENRLYHNPWLRSDAAFRALGYPKAIGENVGRGGRVDSIHRAFMNSEHHRDNILNGVYRGVGVGVVEDGGVMWVTHVFVAPGGFTVGRHRAVVGAGGAGGESRSATHPPGRHDRGTGSGAGQGAGDPIPVGSGSHPLARTLPFALVVAALLWRRAPGKEGGASP